MQLDSVHPSLEWLLCPIEPHVFTEAYFEQKPLRVHRTRSDYYGALFDTQQLNDCLHQGRMGADVSLVKQGQPIELSQYCYPSGLVDPIRLAHLHHEGATVIGTQLNRFHVGLAQLCRALERDLSFRFQTNVYLTPPGERGFRSHYDNHDVFVLQLEGMKRWRFFDTPIELPHHGQSFNPQDVTEAPCSAEFELHAGDLLYLPRGIMHEASSEAHNSLHITLGVLHTNWTELLVEAIARASLKDPALRRALPCGFAKPEFDRDSARKIFQRLLARAASQADFDEALDHFVDDFVSTRHAVFQPPLPGPSNALKPDSMLEPYPNLIYTLRQKAQEVELSCFGRTLTMPSSVEPALRYALQEHNYKAVDLPDVLDDDGKRNLLRKLLAEGLLRIV